MRLFRCHSEFVIYFISFSLINTENLTSNCGNKNFHVDKVRWLWIFRSSLHEWNLKIDFKSSYFFLSLKRNSLVAKLIKLSEIIESAFFQSKMLARHLNAGKTTNPNHKKSNYRDFYLHFYLYKPKICMIQFI